MSFLDLMKNPKTFKRVVCRISGTSFLNVNSILKELDTDTTLYLVHDHNNKHDRMALKVMVDTEEGQVQIGFIPRPINKDVCVLLLSGVEVEAKILGITPPRGGYSHYSVKIEIKCRG